MSKSEGKKTKLLFIMTGSIACYKACHILSMLVKNNYEVEVVLTPSAAQFIGAPTIEGLTQKTPYSDMYEPGSVMKHIHLIRWADMILVAPATANYINKISKGLGDDLASTLYLAHDFKKPFMIAPAMNTSMYLHPETQNSISHLRKLGLQILDTESGVLACGENGWGRLLEPDLIFQAIQKMSTQGTQALSNSEYSPNTLISSTSSSTHRILILAGGTTEPIDTVRSITNTSTGQTGAQMADYFTEMGYEVELITSKNAARPSHLIKCYLYSSFNDLQGCLKLLDNPFDIVINLAAISDFSVKAVKKVNSQTHNEESLSRDNKINSDLQKNEHISVELQKNPKILMHLKEQFPQACRIGFKLTSDHSLNDIQFGRAHPPAPEAVDKVFKTGVQYVIHNDLTDIQNNQRIFNIYSNKNEKYHCSSLQEMFQQLHTLILKKDN